MVRTHIFLIFNQKCIVAEKSIESKIPAFDIEVGALTLNAEGSLVATASIKGTVIRIYSTEEGELL